MSNNIFLWFTYIYIYIYIYIVVILKWSIMAQRVLTSKILNLLKSSPSLECTASHRLPSPLPTFSSIHLSHIAFELIHCCMPYLLVHFFLLRPVMRLFWGLSFVPSCSNSSGPLLWRWLTIAFTFSNALELVPCFLCLLSEATIRNWKEYGRTPKVGKSLCIPQDNCNI